MKLILGDCLEKMQDIEDGSVDLTVTSPPYDNLRTYNGNNALWGEHVWKAVIQDLYRVTKQGGVVVWVVGDATIKGSETGTSFKQALWAMECGFNLHDTMIYTKAGFAFPSNNRYHQTFEFMFVLSKSKINIFNPIKDRKNIYAVRGGDCKRQKDGTMKKGEKGGLALNELGLRYNVWHYKIGGGNVTKDKCAYIHPAIFPEQLAKDHIISWSNEGDTVFDPFMGSGTTGKMAKILNRDFIGIELDPEYFEIATKRIENHKVQLKCF